MQIKNNHDFILTVQQQDAIILEAIKHGVTAVEIGKIWRYQTDPSETRNARVHNQKNGKLLFSINLNRDEIV